MCHQRLGRPKRSSVSIDRIYILTLWFIQSSGLGLLIASQRSGQDRDCTDQGRRKGARARFPNSLLPSLDPTSRRGGFQILLAMRLLTTGDHRGLGPRCSIPCILAWLELVICGCTPPVHWLRFGCRDVTGEQQGPRRRHPSPLR